MGLLPDTLNYGLRMHRECRERCSPPLRVSHPDMHHGICVMHVPWCMPGSLTSGFLWSRWREKRSRHSRCMCNPQFYVSDKRPVGLGHMSRLASTRDRAMLHFQPFCKSFISSYFKDSKVKMLWFYGTFPVPVILCETLCLFYRHTGSYLVYLFTPIWTSRGPFCLGLM